jgi:uncharacterized protein YcbK (DUF882 family)
MFDSDPERTACKAVVMVLLVFGFTVTWSFAEPLKMKRFKHSGDGMINIASEKNGKTFNGHYRDKHGRYSDEAYKAICQVFGAPYSTKRKVLSLRLIEYLDLLEDRLIPGALLTVTSGYRAPAYNTRLRQGGALAAKASLHQYGMAADFFMQGVSSKRIWEYVRSLEFGGTGYYQGRSVHVDVGPTRFWDQKTSGVGTGLSDDNKLIGLVTEYDFYAPGELLTLTFIRMTAFPIKVDGELALISKDNGAHEQSLLPFRPEPAVTPGEKCRKFDNIEQMASIRWRLPSNVRSGRYLVRARFCDNAWEQMPKEVSTPEFEIRMPQATNR